MANRCEKLFIITSDDGETIYNGMRLANVGVKKVDEVGVFMLGNGVCFAQAGSEAYDVMGQINGSAAIFSSEGSA
jgi:uncharacterized protein involved in oxidation of intracellular sulfur